VSAVEEDQAAAFMAPPFTGVAATASDARPKTAPAAAIAMPLASISFSRSRREAPRRIAFSIVASSEEDQFVVSLMSIPSLAKATARVAVSGRLFCRADVVDIGAVRRNDDCRVSTQDCILSAIEVSQDSPAALAEKTAGRGTKLRRCLCF
jgi:hypothetical protein